MKFKHLLLLLAALLISSCGGGYRTDFPPPTGKETYREILPADVGGAAVEVAQLQLDAGHYHGAKATYGAKASIVILEVKDQDSLDKYVNEMVKTELEKYNNRMSGKFNGVWSLRGTGNPGRIYGWQNRSWFFLIQAADDQLFDEVVSKLPYISKK